MGFHAEIRKTFFHKRGFSYPSVAAFIIFSLQLRAQEELIGDVSDGSRSIPVHLIHLYDENGSVVLPDDEPLMPFSTRETCGADCHDYDKISSGWHFNASDPDVAPGRPGEPWIFVDQKTATQIPVSYRPWPGTFRPQEIGLVPWLYLKRFGRHLPGGTVGEEEAVQSPEFFFRWTVSGRLEINCLSCHDAEPSHDQSDYASQIARENFRWAAAASSGFAWVEGSARNMPDTWDPFLGGLLDRPGLVPPSIEYDRSRFNPKGKVFFNIVRKAPAERCYFCHSNKPLGEIGSESPEKWHLDEDVHLSLGMTCVDCHRNGLDHKMVRGNEGELSSENNPFAATLSCEGCHLPDQLSTVPISGRMGSPQPEHPGIPSIHFEKLTCTACHSGPWPELKIQGVKTSRLHALGVQGVNKADRVLPHVVYPVFVRQENGRIAPHKLFWPSYWAILDGDSVVPIIPDVVWSVAGQLISGDQPISAEALPVLSQEQMATVLSELESHAKVPGVPVYVTGGKIHRLAGSRGLISEDHRSARPYSWAYAHDVGPAVQSLGVRGCEDCHATDAPFFFGKVDIQTPVETEAGQIVLMHEMQGLEETQRLQVRRFFKWAIVVMVGFLGLHILGDLIQSTIRRNRR
ncbi:MAG: hypothetical protein V3U24_00800 [Candidatus Neomarinimicrobiota bacterium]